MLEETGQRVLIFDKTVFYAESGGQKWDFGQVLLDNWENVYISDIVKFAGVYIHIVW